MKTIDDLHAAFAGESQANRKYLAFAQKAEREGYPQIAKLFRAVAAAETVHAHNHLRALGEIKSTAENLQTAIAGEHYEVNDMYPEFLADAQAEGHTAAERSFNWALQVEKIHEQLYQAALENLGAAGQEGETKVEYWICQTCGHTHVGPRPPDKCPVCGAKGSGYLHIE
ncbi:MAG TPA: rubrerythrin family protein [Anaerolineae bacterium]|nr:rubrerythrin family protein [Anaerolineae bacterium]HQH38238.1 rubrerythrin family protein [Anaerolineae bacterium]